MDKKQLDSVDGVEGIDFYTFWYKNDDPFKEVVEFNGNVNSITRNGYQQDYVLTLDIAKEICMVVGVAPRTNKETKTLSKQVRKYFIECEKKLKEIQLNDEQLKGLALLRAIEGRTTEERLSGVTEYTKIVTKELKKENENLIEQVDTLEGFIDKFLNKNSLYAIRSIGKALSGLKYEIKDGFSTFGANNIFEYCKDRKILYKQSYYLPYDLYEKYIVTRPTSKETTWGETILKCYFNTEGLKWFFKRLVKEGIIDKEGAKERIRKIIENNNENNDDIKLPSSKGFGREGLPF